MPETEPCPLCGKEATVRVEWIAVDGRSSAGTAHVRCKSCGEYSINETALLTVQARENREKAYLLSGYTRRASETGQPLTLTEESVNTYLATQPPVRTVLDRYTELILYIGKHQPTANATLDLHPANDYPLIFAQSAQEIAFLLSRAEKQGLIENHLESFRWRLTLDGWVRYEELARSPMARPDQCFVAMWFDPSMTAPYEQGFAVAIERAGYKPVRIDRVDHNGKIDDEILAQIRASGLLVADFTGHRGGVYFEAGFAMGLGIPVIFTCRGDDLAKIHFDTRQYNHILWNTPDDLARKLEHRIRATTPICTR